MNRTRTLLISGLATVMVMIALVQTGTIRFNDGVLFAQFERNALILKRELVVISSVFGQEKQDVLKLKYGGNYNGEFVKIESGNVLFKSEGAIGPQRIKINEIKMLKLSDGTEIIKSGRIKRKANETITIQPGDKIMVTYGTISKSVTGSFYGFDNGEISIQRLDKKQYKFYTIIPANLVADIIIFGGKTMSVKDYVWGGVKFGGLAAAGAGLITGLTCGGDDALTMSIGAGFIYSITTVPAGALLGYIRGKVARGKGVEYVIGDGEWVIVK